jgi:hypothetical protein
MKIAAPAKSVNGSVARLSTVITWEESAREPLELYYEVPVAFADALATGVNAFVVAAAFPAMSAGERRLAIDGEVCPRLVVGLQTTMRLFEFWYGPSAKPLALEPRSLLNRMDVRPPRAGSFFTGGIDSLATLRMNRLYFPEGHPEYIRDLVLLYGINFDSDDSPTTFGEAVTELTRLADSAGATLIPMTTNVRRVLNPDIEFFRFRYHGALLAAAAHALAGRLSAMSIGSTHDFPNLMAWGSHPLLDPNLGSSDMRIYHDSLELSRFEKTRMVAEWEAGVQNIKVCVKNWPGTNCGTCEKCLRTMLALVAVGALDRCRAFESRKLDARRVAAIQIDTDNQSAFYEELIEPLRKAGRNDLADAIGESLQRFRGEVGLRGTLRRADRMFLGGGLTAIKRTLSGYVRHPQAPSHQHH